MDRPGREGTGQRHRWYLAGKITEGGDWRLSLVDGLEKIACEWEENWQENLINDDELPILSRAIWGCWDYVGPYFRYTLGHSGDPHAIFMSGYKRGEHGGLGRGPHRDGDQSAIHRASLKGIERCDRLFAWIDKFDCYGTLAEIGYARGLGKEVDIAFQRGRDTMIEDMWFIDAMRTVPRWPDGPLRADTAYDAFVMARERELRHFGETVHQKIAQDLRDQLEIAKALPEADMSSVSPVRLDPQRLFSDTQKREIYLRSNGHCVGCGQGLDSDWHADHIVPHSRGGRTEVVNGQSLCPACNSRKSAKILTIDQ